ncbi:hypothetical protein ILUMI_01294 [Ignelater luminosus]|uniref:Meiosis-specific with OB domain-containing protein n=1 Tax=Ignelater luminosus TaxID=2038154 RepID=A0A8K0DJZ2_IGNLU|nr:hypothetical protein ILUMI_01294 [Ignelater luminosus]
MEKTITTLQRVPLSDLVPDGRNIFIVGIIIAKQEPRKFNDTKSGDTRRERAVWNFTLRDSPICYINVTCWGLKDEIFGINNKFHVGDVVTVLNPQITIRKLNDHGENYRPKVTSPYALTINENVESNIFNHEGNCHVYHQLLRLPTKPIAGAYTLADVHNQKQRIDGVDLVGIVRYVGKVRTINVRDGTERQVREVIILDQTSPSLRVSIWDPDLIIRAGTWKVCNTVLFITDVRCEWSDFARSVTATLTSSTVVTEDPITVETENLRKYIQENPIRVRAILDKVAQSMSNLSAIQNVMNVQQVLDKIDNIIKSPNTNREEQQFTALLYGVVTHLDLDGFSRVVSTRCPRCDTVIVNSIICTNNECPVGLGEEQDEPVTSFDLVLMLSDQTGSLPNCRLNGHTAEMVLKCTVQEFLAFSDEEKTILKWKLLMERCAVRILVTWTGFGNPIISVLGCELASPVEVANRLPHS